MPNLDQFFDRTRDASYNCLDHSREVWRELTGEDLLGRLPKLQGQFRDRSLATRDLRTFIRLAVPESPCIVLMQKPKAGPHIGIYYLGSIMQLGDSGVQYQPLKTATRDFRTVRFYK